MLIENCPGLVSFWSERQDDSLRVRTKNRKIRVDGYFISARKDLLVTDSMQNLNSIEGYSVNMVTYNNVSRDDFLDTRHFPVVSKFIAFLPINLQVGKTAVLKVQILRQQTSVSPHRRSRECEIYKSLKRGNSGFCASVLLIKLGDSMIKKLPKFCMF